ncbi:hypothetical protein RP20_CCG008135 [Aedes albopictus]|nr:hypothetical protein RP20_CCG008135 [Aedes albopictus]
MNKSRLCSTNYEPTYHQVKREVFACCPGWETTSTIAEGCHKPICRSQCQNGGRCTAPDTCTCSSGFSGPQCELDINECKQHKPCDQTCYNTEGSYYCTCRDGFMLQADRHSYTINDVAFEARDMENDVDYDSLDTRLTKLEKIIFNEDRRSISETHELNKKVQYAMDAVSSLRAQVSRLVSTYLPIHNTAIHVIQLIRFQFQLFNFVADDTTRCLTTTAAGTLADAKAISYGGLWEPDQLINGARRFR